MTWSCMSLAFTDNACLCPLQCPSPPLNIAICPRKLSQAVKKVKVVSWSLMQIQYLLCYLISTSQYMTSFYLIFPVRHYTFQQMIMYIRTSMPGSVKLTPCTVLWQKRVPNKPSLPHDNAVHFMITQFFSKLFPMICLSEDKNLFFKFF